MRDYIVTKTIVKIDGRGFLVHWTFKVIFHVFSSLNKYLFVHGIFLNFTLRGLLSWANTQGLFVCLLIECIRIYYKMSSNLNSKCSRIEMQYSLTFQGFELLGRWLCIHFPISLDLFSTREEIILMAIFEITLLFIKGLQFMYIQLHETNQHLIHVEVNVGYSLLKGRISLRSSKLNECGLHQGAFPKFLCESIVRVELMGPIMC